MNRALLLDIHELPINDYSSKDSREQPMEVLTAKSIETKGPMILKTLEEFCDEENVFFSEKERIEYALAKNHHVNKEFKTSMARGFKHVREFKDHPNLPILMMS